MKEKKKEEGHICIFMVDSTFCTSETNITLQSNYPPIKSELLKMYYEKRLLTK